MGRLIDRRSVSLDSALGLLAAVRDEASSRGLALAVAPLHADGALVGDVGASGATVAEDEACVLAAFRAAGLD